MAKIDIVCPGCGKTKPVPEDWVGKSVRCKCGTKFEVAQPAIPSPVAPIPAAPVSGRAVGSDGIPQMWEPGDPILGRYEVISLAEKVPFAEGGFGRVNRVRDKESGLELAVKSVNPTKLTKPGAVDDFVREAEVWMTRIGQHPNAVAAQYVLVLGGLPRVFIEFVSGGSLHDWIVSGRLYEGGHTAALKRMLDVLIQFAWGLHYCHEQGLIHQDVKPGNVMMTLDGIAKVTDFGLAGARSQSSGEGDDPPPGFSLVATFGGMTEAYCSPEQAEIRAKRKAGVLRDQLPPLTRRTDLWSWAVSALQVFHGRVVWPSGSVADKYLKRPAEDERIPPMPPAVLDLLIRCLRRKSEDRPREMAEVARELTRISVTLTDKPYPRDEPKPAEVLADTLNNRAVSLMNLSERFRVAALKFWEEAIRIDPLHPETTYNWGLTQWRSAQMTDQKLLEKLREVRGSATDSARVDYLMGLVHLECGDAQGAVRVLNKALEAGKSGAEIDSALARARVESDPSEPLPGSFQEYTNAEKYVSWIPDDYCPVSWSPDGRFALSGNDETIQLWDVSKRECIRTFEGHSSVVFSVEWSPDGRFALSGSDDETMRLWEVSSGECLRTLVGHGTLVYSVAWSPDGRFALSGSDRTVRLWEMSSGKCVRTFEGHTQNVNWVAFSPDGHHARSGSDDKTVRLWETSSGRCLRTFEGHTGDWNTVRGWGIAFVKQPVPLVTSMAFPVNSALSQQLLQQVRDKLVSNPIVAAELLHQARQQPGCLRREDALQLARLLSHSLAHRSFAGGWKKRIFEGHTEGVTSVSWSPDGRFALSGSNDTTLRLWEMSSGKCLRIFTGDMYQVDSVSFSPDGRFALSGSSKKRLGSSPRPAETLRLWEVSSGECLCDFKGFRGNVDSLTFSPDGRHALSGSDDATLRLWEMPTGKCLRIFKGHTGSVYSVSFSPDGRHALSGGSDQTLRLWETSSRKCLRTFEGQKDAVTSVAWSPDGRFALSGSIDNTMRLWDVASGKCLCTFEGHKDTVTSVAWSPDGRFALSGSIDNTMRLWDVASGKCLCTFEGHTREVLSVSWSPDGCCALSGSADNTVRLWELDWEFEPNKPADWDDTAKHFLSTFLTLHTHYAKGLIRRGKPTWTEDDFRRLLDRLGCAGFGWLRPEGVRRELEKMAASWTGPPALT